MPTIDLGANFVASTTAQITALFSSFSGITILIIGLIGVSVVISLITGALHGNK